MVETDSLSQRPSVQPRVAAGFSQFSKNIPKQFSSCTHRAHASAVYHIPSTVYPHTVPSHSIPAVLTAGQEWPHSKCCGGQY